MPISMWNCAPSPYNSCLPNASVHIWKQRGQWEGSEVLSLGTGEAEGAFSSAAGSVQAPRRVWWGQSSAGCSAQALYLPCAVFVIPLSFQSFSPGKIVCGGTKLSAFRASVNPHLNPGLSHKPLHTQHIHLPFWWMTDSTKQFKILWTCILIHKYRCSEDLRCCCGRSREQNALSVHLCIFLTKCCACGQAKGTFFPVWTKQTCA